MEDNVKAQETNEVAAMRQRIAELERILEISRELTSVLALESLLRKILATAAELTDSETASILLQNGNTAELHFAAALDLPTDKYLSKLVELNIPVEGSIAGVILASRQPMIISDVQADPRYYEGVDRLAGTVTRSILGVPLRLGNQCVGVVEVINKRGNQGFSQDDVKTLTALADQAAIAIENARLYEAEVDQTERLEERVRERTAELQARNEELAAYDHTVAHDLKNPLGLVIGYAQLMEDDYATLSDEEIRNYLHTIMQSGQKMSSIIDELLLLAGLRDMKAEMKPLDMIEIVAEARQRLIAMIDESHAEIILPDVWPAASGYGPWVEEVWVNYLSNAIKYGGQPPKLELGARQQSDGLVRFWVHDNGPGIPPEKQPGLFSRFVRLDPERAKGHGLGLSIVQRIVERLGGHVDVESELGQGSTFAFSLRAVH
jgi:signal transduction histidine kinase